MVVSQFQRTRRNDIVVDCNYQGILGKSLSNIFNHVKSIIQPGSDFSKMGKRSTAIPLHTISKASANHQLVQPEALYSIKPIPGKGLGVFANQDIPKGSRITSEKPLLTALREPGITDPLPAFEAFEVLSPKDQETYSSLSASEIQFDHAMACIDDDIPKEFRSHVARISSIFEGNAFNLGEEDEEGNTLAGVFPLAARFNHDCMPNVNQTWNENLKALTIHSVRHIKAGEEICDSYVPLCQSAAARQDELRAYGFDCLCSVCSRSAGDLEKSDEQRRLIHRLGEDLDFFALQSRGMKLGPISPSVVKQGEADPLNVVNYLEHLLQEEGLTGHDSLQ